MNTVADRIKLARTEAGLSQAALGTACGVSRAAVSQWELGSTKSPNPTNIFAIAKATKVSAYWLTSGKGDKKGIPKLGGNKKRSDSNADWEGGMEPWNDETPLGEGEVEIRMFTEVEIEGGSGSSHAIEYDGPKLRFSARTLAKANVDPAAAACAKVSGRSMEPVLPEGATVGVNTADISVKDGKIYALDHLGHLRVKMLYRQPGGGLRIASFNRDEYPDEFLTSEQTQDVRIIGRVFWWSVLD